jgi:hypothetical protein
MSRSGCLSWAHALALRPLAGLLLTAAFVGCATPGPAGRTANAPVAQSASAAAPPRTTADVAAQRRCMDKLLVEPGTRDASLRTCFGGGLAEPAVAAGVQDWYDAMAARPADIIAWFQQQLRARGVYDGPIDGAVNAPLKEAVSRYREALGLSREPKLSLDFFQAYLSGDHRALAERLAPPQPPAPARPPAAGAATALAVAPRPAPLDLQIAAANATQRFARGEAVQLAIRPSRDAHVYCFLQDENRRITRFFPNRFQRDSRVPARAALQLPGAMRFEITMNPRGVTETVTCFGTDSDVLAALPAELSGADFSALPLASLDQLRQAFLGVTHGTLAQESFQIRARP